MIVIMIIIVIIICSKVDMKVFLIAYFPALYYRVKKSRQSMNLNSKGLNEIMHGAF